MQCVYILSVQLFAIQFRMCMIYVCIFTFAGVCTGLSPRLVTPSAFLSSAKIDISPSPKSSSPPPLVPISPSLSPSHRHNSHTITTTHPLTLDASAVSITPTDTLTSVTPSLEQSDVTFDPSLLGETPPTDMPLRWPKAPPTGAERGENKDDDEKEKFAVILEGGGMGAEESVSSDIEDLRVSQLVDSRATHTTAEANGEKETTPVREKFSEIFGLAQDLEGTPNETPNPLGESPVRNSPVPPVRPQQMFTSTEKSEIVTISSKALTPTREEGTEVVNTTGTPSAEFMELFSNQTPWKGSKVMETTPPRGGTNEMASGFGVPVSTWMEKVTDNAASAWPDVGVMEGMPKLVLREELEAAPDSTHGEGLGAAGRNEVGGGPFNREADKEGAVAGGDGVSYGAVFPSALLTNSKPSSEVVFQRDPETTEGETGQMLPTSSSEQVTPDLDVVSSAAVPVVEVIGEEVREGGCDSGEGGTVRDGTVEESTGAKSESISVQEPLSYYL